MRSFITILLLTTINLNVVWAQSSEKLTSPSDSITLLQAILKLERVHGVSFAYDHELASNTWVSSFNEEGRLDQTLKKLLQKTAVTYVIVGDKIVIQPRSEVVTRSMGIAGFIRDEDSGEPLPKATIHVPATGQYAVSNVDGYFSLLNVPSDTSIIEINYLGHLPYQFTRAELDDPTQVNLTMVHSDEVLSEVVVSENKMHTLEISRQTGQLTVNPQHTDMLSNFGEADIFRSIQLLPGVSGTNETSAGLSIRGGSEDQNLILFDGFTVYHLDHFFGVFSAFNSNVIKNVELHRGGFGAKYGTRVSGVLDMISKNGNQKKPALQVGLNLISGNLVAELPVEENFSVLFAARRSFTDFFQSRLYTKLFENVKENQPGIVSPGNVELLDDLNPTFHFYDLNTKFTWKPSRKDIFNFSIYNGQDNLEINDRDEFVDEVAEISFSQELDETTRWGNTGISSRYARQWTDHWQSEIYFAFSSFFRDHDFLYQFDLQEDTVQSSELIEYEEDNDVSELSVRWNNYWQINHRNSFDFGFFNTSNRIRYQNVRNEVSELNISENGALTGGFLQYTFQPTLDASIKGGLRVTHFNETSKVYWEPRLSANYAIHPNINLKAAFGRYYQFVSRSTLNNPIIGQQQFWLLSDGQQIPVISAYHYIGGATFSLGSFSLDLEGYYKTLDGLTIYSLDSVDVFFSERITDEGVFFQGNGKVRGLELLIKRDIGMVSSWISYTLSNAIQQFPAINEGMSFPANQDQRHEFKWVNLFRKGNWEFSATWIYGSGRPYTEIGESEISVEEFTQRVANGEFERNGARLPDYHRLDLTVLYNLNFNKFGQAEFGLNLLNVYNRLNTKDIRYLVRFDQSTNELLITQRELKMLNFTPSVFLRMSF